jgi:hypothetical protein
VTPWATFFAAELGAAAALTGLALVAFSINLSRIGATPGLPGRAAQALIVLMGALALTSVMLVPYQPQQLLGAEAVAIGVGSFVGSLIIQARSGWRRLLRAAASAAVSLLFAVAGLPIMRGDPAGLYWAAGGVIAALIAGLLDTWAVLIEVAR